MAIRIEYFLILTVGILLLSIVNINPKSQGANISKGEKEIEFQNFSLFDIKENEPAQSLLASKMLKYQNYLSMEEIDLKDEKGYRILSQKAIYQQEYVYMDEGVNILRDDGLKFSTKSLEYNLSNKEIRSLGRFVLEFNTTIIQGSNLILNMNNKQITADNIEAKIDTLSAN